MLERMVLIDSVLKDSLPVLTAIGIAASRPYYINATPVIAATVKRLQAKSGTLPLRNLL